MLLFNLPGPCSGFEIKQKKCEFMISMIALFKVDGFGVPWLSYTKELSGYTFGFGWKLASVLFSAASFCDHVHVYHVKCKFMFYAPRTDFRTACVESV